MSDDRWKVEDGILFSIYIPLTTVSLASKQVSYDEQTKVARCRQPLSLCSPFGAVFPLIFFTILVEDRGTKEATAG